MTQSDPPSMTVSEIKFGSPEYKSECELRQEILRKPLGLNLYDENLSEEKPYKHFGIFENQHCIACAILIPLTGNSGRVKQMAVSKSHQGQGLGKELIRHVEKFSLKENIHSIWLHAREEALNFYLKMGYRIISEKFTEVNIPHYKMIKNL